MIRFMDVAGCVLVAGATALMSVNACADPVLYGFGGAPDTYGTTLAANGARTLDGAGLRLGTLGPALVTDATPALAYGAQIPDPVLTTSDGVAFLGSYTQNGGTDLCSPDVLFYMSGCYGKVRVTVTVGAGFENRPIYLDGWIDWAHNGTFDGGFEHILGQSWTGLAAGQYSFDYWFLDGAGPNGPFYARFRLSADDTDQGVNAATGLRQYGEVEDYGGLHHGQGVPEIDTSAAGGALGLLIGSILLLGERRRRWGAALPA